MQATETITERELQRAANRLERGMAIVWERAEEIVEVEPGVWSVPASRGGEYRVKLGETPACPCRDHEHRGGSCYHITAARVMSEITPAAPARGGYSPPPGLGEYEPDL